MFDYQGEAEVIRGDVEQRLKELERGQNGTYTDLAGKYERINSVRGQISAKAEYHAWAILNQMIQAVLAA